MLIHNTVKPLIKDTPKEVPTKDKPKVLLHAENKRTTSLGLYLYTKDKTAVPESVLIKRFRCIQRVHI